MVAESGVRTRTGPEVDAIGAHLAARSPADGRHVAAGSDLSGHGMSIYHLERTENADEIGKLLSESESAAVRARAAEALGEVGGEDRSFVEQLIRTAVEDPELVVRASAVDALDELGGDALERLLARIDDLERETDGPLPVDAVVDALEHDMPELRMAAANAVGQLGVVEAVPALLSRLDDDSPRVRLRVVRAAGRVGDPRAIEPLSAQLDDSNTRMRREVATALGEIGEDSALSGLIPLLDDDDRGVRLAAVGALGMFSSPRPIEPLVDCFEDADAEVQRAAVYALVELLSNAPPDGSHEMRTRVVEALSTTHGEVVTSALADLFEESTEAHHRRNAVWLLGRVADGADGGEVAVETLVAALDDDDEIVRQFASTSLATIGTAEVEDALLDALDDTFGEGRAMILFTLGTVGTEASRQRLVRLIDEVDSVETQERALSALSRLGGPERR